jgi:NADH:ubiquinone oxidoreductase subunit E
MDTVIRPWPVAFDGRATLTVCVNQRKETFVQSCGRDGAQDILAGLRAEISRRGLNIDLQTIACLGLCAKGPNARVAPSNTWFHKIRPSEVGLLLDSLSAQLEQAHSGEAGSAAQPTPPEPAER